MGFVSLVLILMAMQQPQRLNATKSGYVALIYLRNQARRYMVPLAGVRGDQ